MFTTEAIEEAMQKVMDNYAGGISTHYQFNGKQLALAKEKINHLIELTGDLYASDMHELMFIYELKERLTVCLSVIAHLGARKETRWHSFAENLDYPDKSDDWMKYVNSRYENGQLHMIYRELVGRRRVMSIMIDKAKCKGCGMCTSVCPGSLIYQDSEKKPLSNILRTAGAVPHA